MPHQAYLMTILRPCGKESTKVQITQKIGKEGENSYRKMKRSSDKRHS